MERASNAAIFSEIRELKVVFVKSPGKEVELVTPTNMEDLLFDDVVDLEMMKYEHNEFVRVLKSQGVNVIDVEEMILSILKNNRSRRIFLNQISKRLNLKINFSIFSAEDLLKYLIMGRLNHKKGYNLPVLLPSPNFIFTRDVGCIVGNNFIPTKAFSSARDREMVIFQEALLNRYPKLGILKPPKGSIEGGDVEVLNNEVVLFGLSQRTSLSSVKSIMPDIFESGFKYVITIDIGNSRSFMHLDTVFTRISENEYLVHEPIILGNENQSPAQVTVYTENYQKSIQEGKYANISDAFSSLNIKYEYIICGGNNPIFQEREQWTDGANALAIRPGHIMLYVRNRKTIQELKKRGYSIIDSTKLISKLPANKKFVITLSGNELSRARGGSHCLSFPFNRN